MPAVSAPAAPPKLYRAEPVTEVIATLAETVRWDCEQQHVTWVDILAGRLFEGEYSQGSGVRLVQVTDIGRRLGAYAPHRDGGWLLAADQEFAHLTPDGQVHELARPSRVPSGEAPDAPADWRLNDCICDPAGRVFTSAISQPPTPGTSLVYRYVEGGSVEVVVDGLTIGNGLGFSPDARTFYLNDSGQSMTWAFDYDLDSGGLSNQRVIFTGNDELGHPDGLCVDDEGMVWVGCYGAGTVRRLTPEGREIARVEVPAQQTTSCWLGGPQRRTLFVTAAREKFTAADSLRDPLAGRLFATEVDAPGSGVPAFGGPRG